MKSLVLSLCLVFVGSLAYGEDRSQPPDNPLEKAKAALAIAKAKSQMNSTVCYSDVEEARKLALKEHKPLLVFVGGVTCINTANTISVAAKEYVGDKMVNSSFAPTDKRIVLMVPDKDGKRLYFNSTLKPNAKPAEIQGKVRDAKKAIGSSKLDVPLEKVYVVARGWHTHKCSCGEEISHYSPDHTGTDAEHTCPFCGTVNKKIDKENTRIQYYSKDEPAVNENADEQLADEEPIGFFDSPCPNGNCPNTRMSYRVIPEYRPATMTYMQSAPATTTKVTKTTTVITAPPVMNMAPMTIRETRIAAGGRHLFGHFFGFFGHRGSVRGMFW